ncbi:MAG: hypothetical protein AAF543_05500 [Pseudomonadota bacterium]
MVGYVPPTSLPAQPKRTLLADRPEQVWSQLITFLEGSAFEIDHLNEDEGLVIARYSGDPQPYIDCGSIVTHQNGALDQLSGSASTVALNYDIDEEPVVLNRTLNLDSRIIIRIAQQSRGTVIKTDTTYVVTKIIDIEDASGAVTDGSRETVSFEAGGRGEFSKGTTCQPNGSLDLAVLQSLPNIVGSDEIDRAELEGNDIETADLADRNDVGAGDQGEQEDLPKADDTSSGAAADKVERSDIAATPSVPADGDSDDWVLPEQGLPTAALPTPIPPAAEQGPPVSVASDVPAAPRAVTSNTDVDNRQETQLLSPPTDETTDSAILDEGSPTTIVEDTTRKLLESLDCGGEEWHFCDLIEITTPYRKRNIERLFGLTVNTTESFASQVVGRDLKLDILFPSFPSHLHIAYARRDGTVEHVISSSDLWPADLAHHLGQTDKTIPGPSGLAMIVAIASEKPVFSSAPESTEDASAYLDRLKQRLAAIDAEDPDGLVAASQLLIFVENAET